MSTFIPNKNKKAGKIMNRINQTFTIRGVSYISISFEICDKDTLISAFELKLVRGYIFTIKSVRLIRQKQPDLELIKPKKKKISLNA